jgi:hypothetical protein
MYPSKIPFANEAYIRIVLQGQELLTSNMLVRLFFCFIRVFSGFLIDISLGSAHPRHSIVEFAAELASRRVFDFFCASHSSHPIFVTVFFGNLVGSLFFGAILVRCTQFMNCTTMCHSPILQTVVLSHWRHTTLTFERSPCEYAMLYTGLQLDNGTPTGRRRESLSGIRFSCAASVPTGLSALRFGFVAFFLYR